MVDKKAFRSLLLAVFPLLFFSLINPLEAKSFVQAPNGLFDDPHCFLTINEIIGKNESTGGLLGRELELNWRNFNNQNGDWIGLFDYDPSTSESSKDHSASALEKFDVTDPNGRIKTHYQLEVVNFTLSIYKETCHKYYVSYFKSSQPTKPISSNCFRLYPTWMNDLKTIIGDIPLNFLMIPGTHDAGAWQVYNGLNDNLITRYTMTQEENIHNQFVAGIRYIDIRAAYYPNDPIEKFWVNHDVVKIRHMSTVLNDIKTFVQQTKEIVFLDFHNFPVGFADSKVHDEFYVYLKEILGDYMASKYIGSDVTLNDLWKAGKNVIVTYGNDYEGKQEFLWPYLVHGWGDVNTLKALEDYIPEAIEDNGCKGHFWSAMAELTPKTEDIILYPNKGLRGMANEVNKPLNNWYTNRAWYSKSNIVSTDYFLGNNVIEACVTVNKNRGGEC